MKREVFHNPLTLDNEWEAYGIGDPFVFRFNGTYYLYVSTRDGRTGIKAWESDNLVEWSYVGMVSEDPVSLTAYAPEVVYWNGVFYMYTSPGGKGHYCLTSDSPTGPFVRKTENFGQTIDGSVFIDSDFKWYFLRAGEKGIVVHQMASPFEVDPQGKVVEAYLEGWTEGPSMFKRDGMYFLTFTGNHVFSAGYRVRYAISRVGPLGPFEMSNQNLLLSTQSDRLGLGHNSVFRGPTLHEYYIAYHNLAGQAPDGPPIRQLNISHLVQKEDSLIVPNGYSGVEWIPPMPKLQSVGLDTSEWIGGAFAGDGSEQLGWLSKARFDTAYCAEYTFRVQNNNKSDPRHYAKLVFDYQSVSQYMYLEVDFDSHRIDLGLVDGASKEVVASRMLPEEIDFTVMHQFLIDKSDLKLGISFDQVCLFDIENPRFSGLCDDVQIGYLWSGVGIEVGCTVGSNWGVEDVSCLAMEEVYGDWEEDFYHWIYPSSPSGILAYGAGMKTSCSLEVTMKKMEEREMMDPCMGGIILHANHVSYHPHQVPHAFCGYFLGVCDSQLVLYRVNYGLQEVLCTVTLASPIWGEKIQVTVRGGWIGLKFFNSDDWILSYEEEQNRVIETGKAGLFAMKGTIQFKECKVSDSTQAMKKKRNGGESYWASESTV